MVRLTVDLIGNSMQYINTVRDRELSLRACKIPVLENLGVTRDQFDTIDLTDNDIRKLENIPLLKRLSSLIMHNNRVQQIMANFGEQLPSLVTFALTNNNLCELGDIDPLASCKKLEYLTLIGNPVTHKQHYRLYVIYKCPSVRVLDFKRVRLAERKQAAAIFRGKKGQKAREELVKKSAPLADSQNDENTPRQVRGEDAKKIQEAIASASTLEEVEHLQTILQSGKVPDKGWNLQSNKANNAEAKGDNGEFVAETEEDEEQPMDQGDKKAEAEADHHSDTKSSDSKSSSSKSSDDSESSEDEDGTKSSDDDDDGSSSSSDADNEKEA